MEPIWRFEDWRLHKIYKDNEDKFHLTKNVFGPCYKCNICTYTKSRNILIKKGSVQAIRKAYATIETTGQMNSTMHLMHQRKTRRKQYLSEKWDCDCWVHCSRYERIQFEWAQRIQLQRLSNLSIYINNLDAEKYTLEQQRSTTLSLHL